MSATRAGRPSEALRLPSELYGDVPRRVRLTAGGIAVAVVSGAMAIGALASTILMSAAYTRAEGEAQLGEREGVAVRAEVVHLGVRGGEHPRRVATYRYVVDGRSYTGQTTLRRSDRRALAESGSISIAYVASRPETSWTIGYEPEGFPLWVIPLTSVSLLAASGAMAWRLRRQWMLLSEGRVAQARVTAHKKVHSDKHKAFSVSYEFQSLSGARHTARYEVANDPPPVGTMVPVVYHRDRPQWSAAYPFQFVRPSRAQARFSQPRDRMQ